MAVGAVRVRVGDEKHVLVPAGPHLIGRLPTAEVTVDADQVSRRHAQLRVEDGCWVLEDLDSANGTFLRGERIHRLELEGDASVLVGGLERGIEIDIEILPPSEQPEPPPHQRFGRPTRVHPFDDDEITIGRGDDNAIVLNDLAVSRRHAVLSRTRHGLEVRDLDSFNGTHVGGRRVGHYVLQHGDAITIGDRTLIVHEDRVEEHSSEASFPVAALDLRVETPSGVVLLDGVSIAADESSMVAVLGPSGAGKSTLLGALTGLRPAQQGSVYCGGIDLYANYGSLRSRIGFVPQDDLVQPELTVRESLEFAARLRFPPDTAAEERSARVREVMDELGLAHRADVAVGGLSGGQRKRVSMALELLTKPSVLILDEPTSGLDPGYERSVMMLLRRLADGGRTVIVVTHSTESLHLCDRLLCLAPGGRVAWYGPPEETAAYFGMSEYQEIFQALDAGGSQLESDDDEGVPRRTPTEWQQRFEDHPAHERYVTRPLAAYAPTEGEVPDVAAAPTGGWLRQFATLTRRYVRIVASDRRTLLILVVTAPVLGFMLMLRLPPDQLERPASRGAPLFSQAPLVLFVVIMGLTQIGTSTAAREIVKERAIVEREKAVGLSLSAYVLSKVAVLGGLALLQAAIVVLLATARQGPSSGGLVLGSTRLELVLVGALTSLGAMALGLLVSAVVTSADRVALVIPAVMGFHLLVSSGEIFPGATSIPVVEQAKVLSTARWGFAAMSSTADVEALALSNRLIDRAPEVSLAEAEELAREVAESGTLDGLEQEAPPSDGFAHDRGTWRRDVGALAGITVVLLGATVLVLRRNDRL